MCRTARFVRISALACFSAFLLFGTVEGDSGNGFPDPLRPVDGVPALETYASWPPLDLRERLYRLPWNGYSFHRAAFFQRPVLFVLTVNWNRASQRLVEESFRDGQLLRRVNASYITVAVNADLRPDIRERYQTGAWPTLAFLIPNGLPMLSQANDLGVAKPITTSATDRETLLFLLREGSVYWTRWAELLEHVGKIWAEGEGPEPPEPGPVDVDASEWMARWLLGNADRVEGGFATSARFFAPAVEEYAALRESRGQPALRRHSRFTLERLLASPLYDRREGGLHRIAAGPGFENVEYEKLLEGNAFLVRSLVWSLRGESSPELRSGLSGTAGFLLRVLSRDERGFYLAQAADPTSADGGAYWREEREDLPPPPIDPIVLSGPNVTAGAALIRAGLLLDDREILDAGVGAVDLVLDEGFSRGRGVRHAIAPAGDPRVYLVAQADAALGLVDAHETTGDPRYLSAARNIADFALANLTTPEAVPLVDHLPDPNPIGLLRNERRPLRPNVRLARAMLRLAHHGLGERYREQALEILSAYAGNLSSYGIHGTEAALAVEEAISEPLRITVSGPPREPTTSALRRAAVNVSWPWTIVRTAGGDPPAAASLEIRKGEVRLWVTEPSAVEEAVREVVGEPP